MEPTAWLVGDDVVESFRREGYCTLPRVVEDEELTRLRGIFDSLFARSREVGEGDYYDIAGRVGARDAESAKLPQIVNPEKYAPELFDLDHFARCRSVAAQLLDADRAELHVFGHMILKPPHYGAPTPWHQDEAYMDSTCTRRGLSIWTPLEDATVASGCLHFVPGSHRGEIVEHTHIGDDPETRGLMTKSVSTEDAVACPVAAGEASAHDFRTLHYAGPNSTPSPRRAYVLVFNTEWVPIGNGDIRR